MDRKIGKWRTGMEKNKQTEGTEKIITKYDRKMERRKLEKEKEEKKEKWLKIGGTGAGILAVGGIIFAILLTFHNKNLVLKNTYVKIGDHEVTKLEYDYYYKSIENNYYSYLSSLGLSNLNGGDDAMKDIYDEQTVTQIKEVKALADEAKKNGFVYNSDEEYKQLIQGMEESAKASSVTMSKYYKGLYGSYATVNNIEPFLKENLLAAAYRESLTEENRPGEEEVKKYYEENKNTYDSVDYRSFAFSSNIGEDTLEEEKNKAMEDIKKKAKAMEERRKAGEDFEALCIENANEDQKSLYENAEGKGSLTEGSSYGGTPVALSEWLFDEKRKSGDLTTLPDETNSQYYVVEFVKRYYDETKNETIENTIANEKVSKLLEDLTSQYTVADVAGELTYLTQNAETK